MSSMQDALTLTKAAALQLQLAAAALECDGWDPGDELPEAIRQCELAAELLAVDLARSNRNPAGGVLAQPDVSYY